MDSWAGNRDAFLENQIITDFDHYIDENQILTLLLYAERGSDPSFHDYISVTVSSIETGPILSYNPMSHDFLGIYVNETDYALFELWNDGSENTPPPTPPTRAA